MAAKRSPDSITPEQQKYYDQHREELIELYLADRPRLVDPDAVRDLFMPIGYDRSNVLEFKAICKKLTADIFDEVLIRNKRRGRRVIFAAGLPATGKSTHLKQIARQEIVYDGTINEDSKFVSFVQKALDMGFLVEIIVYSANPVRAFKSNLERGDTTGRYVPISQYEKVAASINRRVELIKTHFEKRIKFRNFEHTKFQGKLKKFSKIIIKRDELEAAANEHRYEDPDNLRKVLG